MTRNLISRLPGKCVIDAAGANVPLYSSDPIIVELVEETIQLSVPHAGEFAEVPIGRMVQVKIKPTGFTAAAIAAVLTHGAVRKGGLIQASTDKTLDIHTIDGFRRRIPNAFVFGEPAITCKSGSTIMGEVTFYGLLPLNADPAVLASFYSKSAVSWSEADFDAAHSLTPAWDFSWPLETESAWDAIDTVGGVTITPRSVLDEIKSDRNGLIGHTISDYGVGIKASPLNITEDLVLAESNFGGALGAQNPRGRDMILNAVGGGAFIRLYGAQLQKPFNFGFDAKRNVVGELNWVTRPSFTAGAQGAHILVSTEDPDAPEEE